MKAFVRCFVKKVIPKQYLHYCAYNLLIRNQASYLYQTGWLDSLEAGKPIDAEGNLVPWMNYPIINLLKDRLQKDFHLFEYGSGFSTTFYAKSVDSVTSVEYDKSWFDVVREMVPGNAEIIYTKNDIDGEYCRVINTTGKKYDVVIVDGRDRVNCVKQCVSALSDRGVVLLDDSQREKYKAGLDFMKEQGFRTLDLESLKPTDYGIDRTTVCYRDRNCLGI